MKYYLSSYKLGNSPENFANLFTKGKSVAYIPNATDITLSDPERLKAHIADDVEADMDTLDEWLAS